MADLIVPRVGVSVTEVTIVEWLVDDGATVIGSIE
jgi:pyruvate/2-oxoglutarate dehydrogenase complex dihydrolipoamide acyltransferase (E2) component